MDAAVTFLECPEYMDAGGSLRCGLPAEVEYRYAIESSDGPLESAKIRCPRGHWFNGPVGSLTLAVGGPDSAPGLLCEAPSRRPSQRSG